MEAQQGPASVSRHGVLRLAACAAMTLDHIAAVLLARLPMGAAAPAWLPLLYRVFRGVGRAAFPLFSFLLVEGLRRTRSLGRYLGRMALFCALSEVPFDLAFSGMWFDPRRQNTLLTLLLGLMAMAALQSRHGRPLPAAGAALACVLAAELLRADYGGRGVAFILLLYLGRELCARPLGPGRALPRVGKAPGRGGAGRRWPVYLFYPAHLLLLWFFALFIPA